MTAIRLLILGIVIKEPIHGYEIRRQLENWNAEQWANVAYGSIYSALSKMTQEGLLQVAQTEQIGARPARVVYEITEIGRAEFDRLLHEHWLEYKPMINPFQVAITFMNHLSRDELLKALRQRTHFLKAQLSNVDFYTDAKLSDVDTPRHIRENIRLMAAYAEAELTWIRSVIEQVERGELP
ncbi:MAG: PadR family transcriptional regulator [Anaerolineae bacterium]|jgi:DNA-binding PadR family transcriptional regulator|nr:PadR family transcriptional regulator [Anaerolineae bacterium]